jgi:hypothetical protein
MCEATLSSLIRLYSVQLNREPLPLAPGSFSIDVLCSTIEENQNCLRMFSRNISMEEST